MAAVKGRDILIKVNIASVWTTIGGMRTKSLSLGSETVDISDSDSPGRWRELLAAAGINTASISGSGVFKNSTGEAQVKTSFFAGTFLEMQFLVPDFGTIEGEFQVTTLEYTGTYQGEMQFSQKYESAGEITFTAS